MNFKTGDVHSWRHTPKNLEEDLWYFGYKIKPNKNDSKWDNIMCEAI